MKFSKNCRIHLHKTEKEKEISELNDFIAEYMLNKRSIHVFMKSKKFMRCLLNQSFLCCLVISVDVLGIGEQLLSMTGTGAEEICEKQRIISYRINFFTKKITPQHTPELNRKIK